MDWDWQRVTWAALALALIAAETLVPGAFLMWLGFAAAATFVLVLLFPGMSLLAQAAAFVVLSFAFVQVYRRWFRGRGRVDAAAGATLNRRAEALVGRVVALDRAIVNGQGRVQIADAYWDVSGPALEAGRMVRITGADGMTLRVEAAD